MKALLLALLAATSALAGDVLAWRRDGSGTFPDADPPVTWSTTEHVAWRTRLPSWGNGSPVVVGDKVFVTAEPTALVAVRASDGAILWRKDHGVELTLPEAQRAAALKEAASIPTLRAAVLAAQRTVSELRRTARSGGSTPELLARIDAENKALDAQRARLADLEARYPTAPAEQSDQYASGFVGFAASTPVSDGRRVFAVFANGVVAARSLDGALLWATFLGRPAPDMLGYHDGHAASPVLAGGTLVVGLGTLTGLDPTTGAVKWRSDVFRDFGTPAVVDLGGQPAVVTPSGKVVRASDGAKLGALDKGIWYVGPVAKPGGVWMVGNHTSELASATEVQLGLSGSSLTKSVRFSQTLPTERYYGAPSLAGGFLHVASRRGSVLAIDPAKGTVAFRGTLPVSGMEEVYPSTSAAKDRLYVTSDKGTTLVLQVTPGGYRTLATNHLEELRSSLVFVGRDVYVRGMTSLWKLRAP